MWISEKKIKNTISCLFLCQEMSAKGHNVSQCSIPGTSSPVPMLLMCQEIMENTIRYMISCPNNTNFVGYHEKIN